MTSLSLPIACFSYLALTTIGSGPSQYRCTLSPVLRSSESLEVAILRRLPAGATAVLPEQPPRDSQLFAGEIPIRTGSAVKVVAAVSPSLETIWYVDVNLDGKFTKEERIRPGAEGQRFDLPVRIGSFKSYPLFIKEQVLTREAVGRVAVERSLAAAVLASSRSARRGGSARPPHANWIFARC